MRVVGGGRDRGWTSQTRVRSVQGRMEEWRRNATQRCTKEAILHMESLGGTCEPASLPHHWPSRYGAGTTAGLMLGSKVWADAASRWPAARHACRGLLGALGRWEPPEICQKVSQGHWSR